MVILFIIIIIFLLLICSRLIAIIDHLVGIIVILVIIIAILAFKGTFSNNSAENSTVNTQSEMVYEYETEEEKNTYSEALNENSDDIDHYVNEYVYANVDDSLILREGPSTDYEQILKIQNGEAMYAYYAVVNFRGYCWYYVDYNGVQGYVLSKYTTN